MTFVSRSGHKIIIKLNKNRPNVVSSVYNLNKI
jgi:hypothetical protein